MGIFIVGVFMMVGALATGFEGGQANPTTENLFTSIAEANSAK